jgi:hypothetical protein
LNKAGKQGRKKSETNWLFLLCVAIHPDKQPRMRIAFAALLGAFALISTPGMLVAQDAPNSPGAPAEDEANKTLLANVDKVPGFGGIAFGSDFAKSPSFSKFEIEQDRGNLKIYKNAKDQEMFGPVALDETLYYVLDGKFYGVALHTDDGQDSLALRSVLTFAFGQGTNSSDGGPSTVWIGKTNGALFDLNTATGEGVAFLFNNALHDEQLKQQSASAKNAAEALIQGKQP